jgi:hypothetical protein
MIDQPRQVCVVIQFFEDTAQSVADQHLIVEDQDLHQSLSLLERYHVQNTAVLAQSTLFVPSASRQAQTLSELLQPANVDWKSIEDMNKAGRGCDLSTIEQS